MVPIHEGSFKRDLHAAGTLMYQHQNQTVFTQGSGDVVSVQQHFIGAIVSAPGLEAW